MNKPVYHVRHDLQPGLTLELLLLLEAKSPCRVVDLIQFAESRGYRLATRSLDQLLSSLSNLRIVTRNAISELVLTPLGKLIAVNSRYRPELLAELLHFTYYTLYDFTGKSIATFRFSWAYRQVCDFLWEQGNQIIHADQLVTLVQEQAQIDFGDVEEYGVSFSRDSVTGILQWLEALDPPCIHFNNEDKRIFARRPLCPLDTLLIALQYLAYTPVQPTGLQLQLAAPIKQAVARLCLIEPDVLDDLLLELAQSFGVAYRQTERGQWISLPGERSPLPLTFWHNELSKI